MQGKECYGARTLRGDHLLLPILALIGTVSEVHDGDTFRFADGTRIRLEGIDANELNGMCHKACARMSGKTSRDTLAHLILAQKVECEPRGKSYRRVVARCTIRGIDISCYQVRSGAAVRWVKYDPAGRLAACDQN